jgi:hypothetical protein
LLGDELAGKIAPLVLTNMSTRYPYHDSHLFQHGETPADFTQRHPAFGNSFDWHSSVHSHWTAVQLLAHFAARRQAPPVVEQLQAAVVRNLAPVKVAAESAYLAAHPSYERPYGWAWALKLAESLHQPPSPGLALLSDPIRALADQIRAMAMHWLAFLPAPVRHGVHGNSAFSLGLMFEASQSLGFADLANLAAQRACHWFAGDRDYPYAWEPSGYDFLSPGLAEADLMRRVLSGEEFKVWWRRFMPGIGPSSPLFTPVDVPSVGDGHIAHLHGLNLSRAAMLARIAAALFQGDGTKAGAAEFGLLMERAAGLYRAGVAPATHGDYLSTHWLPTFAWDAASSIDAANTSATTGVTRNSESPQAPERG